MFRRLLFVITAATVALAGCTSAPAAPTASPLTDPKDILTKSVLTLKDLKTMHFHADVTGNLNLDLMGTGNASPIDLKGTSADGDIDIPNKKIHISFGAPLLLNLAGDIIVIGDTTYMKVTPILGTKYMKSTSTSSGDPIASATDMQKTVDELNKFLNEPGVTPTKQADEKCGDKDCYRVSMNLTSEQLGGVTGGLSSSAPSGTGKVDVWVQKNDLRPAKISIDAAAGDQGTVNVTFTISNYDAPVTVNAPADADIAPAAS
jgi:hypothetical protein